MQVSVNCDLWTVNAFNAKPPGLKPSTYKLGVTVIEPPSCLFRYLPLSLHEIYMVGSTTGATA